MKGQVIPPDHEVARCCTQYDKQEFRQGRYEVLGASFLRRKSEEYLSVNWVQLLGKATRQAEFEELCSIYDKKIPSLRRDGKTALIAILNVGATRSHVHAEAHGIHLDFLHEPSKVDASHSGVFYPAGFSDEEAEQLVAELIAESVEEGNVSMLALPA